MRIAENGAIVKLAISVAINLSEVNTNYGNSTSLTLFANFI